MTLRPRMRPGPLLEGAGVGDFGVSPPEVRFRNRALSFSSFDSFVGVSAGLAALSKATCLALSSSTSCFEIDDFLSPMWYSLEKVDAGFSFSPFSYVPSSPPSVDLFDSGPSVQINAGISMKTYVEYLGGGFLVLPKAVPNKLRRSAGLLSEFLLALLCLGDGPDSSTESRLVEFKETGVEAVSLPSSPCEPLDSRVRPNTFLRLLFLLLPVLGISLCVDVKSVFRSGLTMRVSRTSLMAVLSSSRVTTLSGETAFFPPMFQSLGDRFNCDGRLLYRTQSASISRLWPYLRPRIPGIWWSTEFPIQ